MSASANTPEPDRHAPPATGPGPIPAPEVTATRSGDTAAELRRARRDNRELATRNTKLVELLTASRRKLATLNEQLEQLAAPPSTYGTYLEPTPGLEETCAEVFTSNRRMRLAVSPLIERSELVPGARVRLGEGAQVVEVCGFDDSGEMAGVTEVLEDHRALVVDTTGEERLVRLAGPLLTGGKPPRPGDTLLVDTRAGYAFEIIPKTEVAKLALEEVPDVTWADIGGLDDQITRIRDAVELPFTHPELYRTYNLRAPKGVLLYGPPGCGKTLIAKAVANSLSERIGDGSRSYFINVKGPELLNKYVGESERQIRLIFERARELAGEGRPVIVFFDEMESIFRTRGTGVSSDMETTVVPQLLAELDGVESLSNVIVIGATNREELIDPAILRPGRLDVKIRVQRPDRTGAREIFHRLLHDNVPVAGDPATLIDNAAEYLFRPRPFVELTYLDGGTQVFHYHDFVSGAMIANIVDRAKKEAIKDHLAGRTDGITDEHLARAIDAENAENEDLPNTSNPDAWSRITGRPGARVTGVRVLDTTV
ncbi:proteasome ATPase [Corynebacterium sp. P7202]|uniref:AAA ATPase forming ring-shaped complexes n=1 Tax=Corynebacterium pygosceleis TaxID=2800406 RepID=A0A9Q4C7M5_9CORY|nr:proteasome ATPase [Corynebacterium pygosceleis]MCK7637053.1 proteasome ATPase [Corynebacterium pygosceleis]MCX7467806.1 proteasome ATPase [Corynebacterium pygosceleis]